MKKVQLIRFAKTIQQRSKIYRWVKLRMLYILYPFLSTKLSLDYKDARAILEENRPNPGSTSIHKNSIDSICEYDLTIIIPAYNVAPYIYECVHSILTQETDYRFRVVVVDDGSTDGTGEIIDSFGNDERVSIIHQENSGIAISRNQGIYHITSKYVSFVDSDDYLPQNAIQKLLDAAYTNDADIVEGSHSRLYGNTVVKSYTHIDANKDTRGTLIGMPWGKVFRSTLFSQIIFPEKLRFEDSICTFLLYPLAEKIVTISDEVYIYRIVSTSDTHSSANKQQQTIDTLWVTELMLKEHEVLKLANDDTYCSSIIKQFVLNYNRMKRLPDRIQQAAFIESCELFNRYCSSYTFAKKEQLLVNAIKNRDFGRYKLYCCLA